jgi:hypothetical protein
MSDNYRQVDFTCCRTGQMGGGRLVGAEKSSQCEVAHTGTALATGSFTQWQGHPAVLSREATMFDNIVAKWSEISGTAPRHITVVIPLDRPDLMADAGFDGLRYQGSGSRVRVHREWLAASWMPFHAAAG